MSLLVPSSALIVDDEAHVRAYVKLILISLGVERFFEASDVAAARVVWAEDRPDLVLLDVNLPDESGLSFLKEVRADDDEVYIVMLSANAQVATVKEAVNNGADGFIRKDSSREQVVAELREIFDQSEE